MTMKDSATFSSVTEFERQIAEFFGAPYAVAVDSCTHGLELCLRHTKADYICVPKHTYLSVPMLAHKLGIRLQFKHEAWTDYYELSPKIFDAAVLWRKDSYILNTFMCVSFQYQKHLSLYRGGIVLCMDIGHYLNLKEMSYDGREHGIPWREQNIKTMGYHYYMTPETAQLGLEKLPAAIATPPRIWSSDDYPDLTQMDVFK